MNLIALPDSSPLVTLRLTFHSGAASDPPAKPGAAWLTALMMGSAGTRRLEYKGILEAFFPAAVSVLSSVDKEMITFSVETHRDNLDAVYEIFRDMLLDPGWREEDFSRVRDDAITCLAVGLRSDNDEELAKEVLAHEIYAGHPYGWPNAGTVSALLKMTLDDLRGFHLNEIVHGRLTAGVAGGCSPAFIRTLEADIQGFSSYSGDDPALVSRLRDVPAPSHPTAVFVDKPSRGVAISFGFPIAVRRGHPDFLPLLVATSALGQHRMSSGRLFTRMRQLRGLNYGDYAYIEHFPGGMFALEPPPNLGRQHQIFQVWIRPVEPDAAHFALRLALYELERLIDNGLDPAEFSRTRSFLSKYSSLLLSTKSDELGYAIDSRYYGISRYPAYVRDGLAAVTLEQVNDCLRRHLSARSIRFAFVAPNPSQLCDQILSAQPSPMTYNSPKPAALLAEDKIVESWTVPFHDARIIPVDQVFA